MLENLNLVTMLLVVVVSGAFLALRGTCRAAGGETETSLEPRSLPSFAVRYGQRGRFLMDRDRANRPDSSLKSTTCSRADAGLEAMPRRPKSVKTGSDFWPED
jgi:hypothetical protein